MKFNIDSRAGICDSRPEWGDTCDRCDKRLWLRVFWLQTSYEYVEGDYVCVFCFRLATDQLNIRQRFKVWKQALRCKRGRHPWYETEDWRYCLDCGISEPTNKERKHNGNQKRR